MVDALLEGELFMDKEMNLEGLIKGLEKGCEEVKGLVAKKGRSSYL